MTRAERAEKALRLIDALEKERKSGAMPGDLRQQYIAEAAYYKAERRGFTPGFEAQDWAEAEAEIEALLGRE